MSMNFSEFIRRLGADPGNQDPEFLRALDSGPEFREAADKAYAFETLLARAMRLPAPDNLLDKVLEIGQRRPSFSAAFGMQRWRRWAIAASFIGAVTAAGINWQMNPGWDSMESYLSDHYAHDGATLEARAEGRVADNVEAFFARFEMSVKPELAHMVGVIKLCRTPDGKGVHMVLNTVNGPVTVIYMPETTVSDRELISFDGMSAMLVSLQSGSAAIIGTGAEVLSALYPVIHDSLVPATLAA